MHIMKQYHVTDLYSIFLNINFYLIIQNHFLNTIICGIPIVGSGYPDE